MVAPVVTLANKAAQAALKLLKKPSIMVDDTAKFAKKFGEKKAIEHLGQTRVNKAKAAIASTPKIPIKDTGFYGAGRG